MGKLYTAPNGTRNCLPDTTKHTFFECVRWNEERRQPKIVRGRINSENIVNKMLERELTWATAMTKIMLSLKYHGSLRKKR